MPNLVGIGNSQVPTNAMLGGLAYQDSVGEINIDKIKARTSDTARQDCIFVYDTRKDSDGGAWRHRTENTTWYTESASATRGSRKEFPAVAIIVGEIHKITIYDGDDPNCPMWMVINRGADSEPTMLWDGNNANSCESIAAKNGTIMWSTSSAGSFGADFIGERWIYFYNADTNSGFRHNGGGIINRNKAVSSRTVVRQFRGYPNSGAHRAVAMTVRPNAETDPVTKLPIPLIMVGTDGGLAFIGDKHTDHYGSKMRDIVVIRGTHGGSYNQNRYIDFDSKTNAAIFTENYGTGNSLAYKINVHKFPSGSFDTNNTYSDFQEHNRRIQTNGNVTIPKLQGNYIYGVKSAGGNGRFAVRTGDGTGEYEGALNIVQEEPGKDWQNTAFPANSRVVYIASDYNSGWLHGDIRRAHLSSTDDTNVTGSELLANPGPSFSNTNNWYLDASNQTSGTIATLTVSSGRLVFTHSDTNSYWDGFGASFTCTVGEVYVVRVNIHSATNMNVLRISNTASQHDAQIATSGTNVAGVHYHTFTATATTMYLHWNAYTTAGTIQLNSVSVRIGEEDRSIAKKGLQVFGTINKTPVATGAELVGYSNWSTSNYLKGGYVDADDDFGSGDYSVIAWAKTSVSHTGIIWSIRNTAAAGSGWSQLWANNDNIRFGQNTGGYTTANVHYHDGNWHCWIGVKRNNKCILYFDGLETNSTTMSQADPSINSSSEYYIGRHHDAQHPWQGSLALVRYSLSAMGADIVEKIYEDEKLLFQENAKCSLYGTSNEVKAIAYDDSKEILHVGTSAGRSDFHRLNRINNTTTAVTHAISASDGLIAEQ